MIPKNWSGSSLTRGIHIRRAAITINTGPRVSLERCLRARNMYPNLKLTIFKRGLRQNHLAREVGIHEVALSKIILGVREPSPPQRLLMCQYFGAEEVSL